MLIELTPKETQALLKPLQVATEAIMKRDAAVAAIASLRDLNSDDNYQFIHDPETGLNYICPMAEVATARRPPRQLQPAAATE